MDSSAKKKSEPLPAPEIEISQLAQKLSDVVSKLQVPVEDISTQLIELEKEHGIAVYQELLFLLAHLKMDPEEARSHWRKIENVRDNLEELIGNPVDVRVALVHYFVSMNKKLRNPKVIELHLFRETQASVYRDELTGLFNFRYFQEHLPREIDRSDRQEKSLSLVMIDIDDFKLYNDQYGHSAGNEALMAVAGVIMETIRSTDIAVRYGGEEFIVMFPVTPKKDAIEISDRIRQRIASHQFPSGNLRVSLGVAAHPGDAISADKLVDKADSAMYLAKSRGKNQVCLFGDDHRSFRRITAELEGAFCLLAAEFHSFTTMDVSEEGILLIAPRKLPIGSLLHIKMNLEDGEDQIACSGKVVRVEEESEDRYQAAIRIVDIAQQDRFRFFSYLRSNED